MGACEHTNMQIIVHTERPRQQQTANTTSNNQQPTTRQKKLADLFGLPGSRVKK